MTLGSRRVLVTRAAHQAGKLSSALRALGCEPVEVPVLEIRPPDDLTALDAALLTLAGVESRPSSHAPLHSQKSVILSDRSAAKEVEGPAVALRAASPATEPGCPILPQSHRGRVGDHAPQLADKNYDWLILTSANTVRALRDRAAALGLSLANFSGKVAAVGAATAIAAREAGLIVSLIPETYVAESLIETLKGQASGKRVLIARAAVARDVIPDALRAAGAEVGVVDAYRNAIPDSAPKQLRLALELGIAAATFTSSSSVTHLAEVAKQAGIAFPFANVAAVSIGPITTQTLRQHNWPPAAEAASFDIPGLAAAVANLLR